MKTIDIDKTGSATSPLNLAKQVTIVDRHEFPVVGDVIAVRALSESVTYGNIKNPSTPTRPSCKN